MVQLAELSNWMEGNAVVQEYFYDEKVDRVIGSCQFATAATMYGALKYSRGEQITSVESSREFMNLLRRVDQYPLWDKQSPRIPFASIAMGMSQDTSLEVIFSHEGTRGGRSIHKQVDLAKKDNNLFLAWGQAPQMNLIENPLNYPGIKIKKRTTGYSTWKDVKKHVVSGFHAVCLVDSNKFYRDAKHTGIMAGREASGIHVIGVLGIRNNSEEMLVYDPDGGFSYEGNLNPSTGKPKSRVNWISTEHLQGAVLPTKPMIAVRNR